MSRRRLRVVAAVIDFDPPPGSSTGGRFQCELTDVDPSAVRIGDRVEMTFRRLYTQDGIHIATMAQECIFRT